MNIFRSIIDWSRALNPWEREAVRRLVMNGELTTADEDEIIRLIKDPSAGQGSSELEIPDPQPAAESPVSLLNLKHETGVNALAPGQLLDFGGPKGLTVIYGDNGSGKSGYSRVLKRACRSRHPQPPILHDVFAEASLPAAAKAEFVFQNGDTVTSEGWTDGSQSSEALASIAVFDAECARLYVEKEGEIAYRPYGLEVFDQLGEFYRRMKKRLLDEATGIQCPECTTTFEHPTVRSAVEAASGSNSKETLALLSKLGTVSDDERKESTRLQVQITQLENSDPQKLALARKTLAETITTTLEKIASGRTTIRDSLAALPDAMKKASDDRAVAVQASKIAFSKEPVSGVGSEQWKAMFDDARTFSTEVAYPDQEFPVVGEGSRCLFCHQPLDDAAKERLTRFADYIGSKAEDRARESANAYNLLRTGAIDAAMEIARIEAALIERVAEQDEDAGKALSVIRDGFSSWRTSASAVSSPDQWPKLAIPIADTSGLTRLVVNLMAEADELARNSNADAIKGLKEKLSLLTERIALSKVHLKIVEASECEAKKRRLKDLVASIDTGPVSRQASKIAKQVLTEALCNSLNKELDSLNGSSLSVEFAKKGEGGDVLHYLRLRNAPKGTRIQEILSEGEHRCLAIAAFLAELKHSGHLSAIVLDDPVSSLDHKHRDAVAARLVEEAKTRQVVIFTHDLAFLYALHRAAAKAQVPTRPHCLARTPAGAGVLVDALYPEAMHLRELIKHVRTEATSVTGMSPNDPARRGRIADCYDLIRAGWERVVEESLLRSVVKPFDKAVHTQQLKGVIVTDEDYKTVFWAMTTASEIVEAHRKPAGAGTSNLPKDADLIADINALDAYRKVTEDRAGKIGSARKLLESPPSH